MESRMSSAPTIQRLPMFGVLAAAVFCIPTGHARPDVRPDQPDGTGMWQDSDPTLATPPAAGANRTGMSTISEGSAADRTGMSADGTSADGTGAWRSQASAERAETPLERAERARMVAEDTLRRAVLPQPMPRERFLEYLNAIDPALASDTVLRDAHATYLEGIEQQRESTARQILRLLPASYRYDAARLSFAPRPTPELVALLSLREKSSKAIIGAERRLLDTVATATSAEHRTRLACANLAWRLERLPSEQLLPSTRLTLLALLEQLRLDPTTATAIDATVGDYAAALDGAVESRTTLLLDADRQRALIETTAGTLWRFAPAEISATVEMQLAEVEERAFASELAIRDIHFDALARIRARLQPRDGRRLVELWQRALHPELFEDERMLSRMIEETLAHPSFTADQDTALLDSLETSFQRLEPLSRAACEAADLVLPRPASPGLDEMLAEIDARIAVIDAQNRRRAAIKEAMQRIRGMLGDADPAITARVDDAIYTIDSLGRADQFEGRALALRRNALGDAASPGFATGSGGQRPSDRVPGDIAPGTVPAIEAPDSDPSGGGNRGEGVPTPRDQASNPGARSGRGGRGGRRSADN
jgi:hypothetical protein